MQEDKIYEYSIIRLVPKVEREEFFNVGLILFSKKAKYIRAEYLINQEKYHSMQCQLEMESVLETLNNFKEVAEGSNSGGEIAKLDVPERFRWLTAVRSSVIQTSRPHPGISQDLDQTFERLFEELVK